VVKYLLIIYLHHYIFNRILLNSHLALCHSRIYLQYQFPPLHSDKNNGPCQRISLITILITIHSFSKARVSRVENIQLSWDFARNDIIDIMNAIRSLLNWNIRRGSF